MMFDAWSTDKDGNNKIKGTDIYKDPSISDLYANYRERRTFTIKYDAGSGSGNMSSFTILEGNGFTVAQSEFSKSGYKFSHWQGSNGSSYYEGNWVVPTGNLTLTAIWYKPSSHGGGSGGGGGGGGGARGTLPNNGGGNRGQIQTILNTLIISEIGSWIYNPTEDTWGYKISADTEIGRALLANNELKTKYALVDDGTHLQLKDGLYKIFDGVKDYYYAFDDKGVMMTGFITTTEDTEMYALNIEKNSIVYTGHPEEYGKYYLFEYGALKGVLWNQPILKDGVYYLFDNTGKVVIEAVSLEGIPGEWDISEETGRFRYKITKVDGTTTYATGGAYAIPYLGQVKYYLFDEIGEIKTGLQDISGHRFYFQEQGLAIGSLFNGSILIGDKIYTFDALSGYLIAELDINTSLEAAALAAALAAVGNQIPAN